MPTRINGIGTTYLGSKNAESYHDTCSSCHRQTTLQNYETGLWFTVLYLPVLPLGKHQIIGYCPLCTRHMAMPLNKWHEIQNQSLGTSSDSMRAAPNDPDAALNHLATLRGFHRTADATTFCDELLQRFGNVSRVQFTVGGWYEYIHKNAEADACFERAFQLDPQSLPARRAVALTRIEQGRLPEAQNLLREMDHTTPNYDPSAFIALAKAQQKQQQHEAALDTLHTVLEFRPALAKEKSIVKLVRASEKALGSTESMIPSTPFLRTPAFKWLAGTALVLGALILINSYIRSHRTLYVVNGLKVPLNVKIDDSDMLTVGPQSFTKTKIGEGEHHVQVLDPKPLAGEPVAFTISAGWLQRFFSTPAFVLDPARATVVLWEQTTYRDPGQGNRNQMEPHMVHAGETLVTYPHVNHLFEPFPNQLQAKKGQTMTRTRVSNYALEPFELLLASDQLASGKDLLPYAESHISVDPDNSMLLLASMAYAQKQNRLRDYRDFLAKHLNDRPVHVAWHRTYQHVSDYMNESANLIARYDAFLAANPKDPSLLYLRARIDPDQQKAVPLYEEALEIDPQHAYARFGLGCVKFQQGDFVGGKNNVEIVCQTAPDPERIIRLQMMQQAVGEFAPLEADLRQTLKEAPFNLSAEKSLQSVLISQGRLQDAAREHRIYARAAKVKFPMESAQYVQQSWLNLLYTAGDVVRWKEAGTGPVPPDDANELRWQMDLENGVVRDPPAEKKDDPIAFLLCSLATADQQQPDQAAQYRRQALAVCQQKPGLWEEIIAILSKADRLTWDDAVNLNCRQPSDKVVVLILLSDESPELKSQLLTLARKFNFQREFPHQYLACAIVARGGKPDPKPAIPTGLLDGVDDLSKPDELVLGNISAVQIPNANPAQPGNRPNLPRPPLLTKPNVPQPPAKNGFRVSPSNDPNSGGPEKPNPVAPKPRLPAEDAGKNAAENLRKNQEDVEKRLKDMQERMKERQKKRQEDTEKKLREFQEKTKRPPVKSSGTQN